MLILSPLFNTNSGILIFVEFLVYENITFVNLTSLKLFTNFISLLSLKYSSNCFLDVLNLSFISINLTKLFKLEYNFPNADI